MNTIIEICDELLIRIRQGEDISKDELDNKLLEIRTIALEEAVGEDL